MRSTCSIWRSSSAVMSAFTYSGSPSPFSPLGLPPPPLPGVVGGLKSSFMFFPLRGLFPTLRGLTTSRPSLLSTDLAPPGGVTSSAVRCLRFLDDRGVSGTNISSSDEVFFPIAKHTSASPPTNNSAHALSPPFVSAEHTEVVLHSCHSSHMWRYTASRICTPQISTSSPKVAAQSTPPNEATLPLS